MNDYKNKIDMLWDDNPIDVTAEANFIWSIANKLRGTYMPDKYGDVIIPMTILRRFECALEPTKAAVIEAYEKNPAMPALALEKKSGFQFYNTSHYDLKELQNESDKLAENFMNYIEGFSANVQDIMKQLKLADHIKTMDDGGCLLTVVKRSYGITEQRIENMLSKGCLSSLYDEAKVYELENPSFDDSVKENESEEDRKKRLEKEAKKIKDNQKKLQVYYKNKPIYDGILQKLNENKSDKVYLKLGDFEPFMYSLLSGYDKKLIDKVIDGLSVLETEQQLKLNKDIKRK